MKKVYRKSNPHLFDVAINDIQTALNDECDWLNSIFGRCERLVKEINGQRYYTANWYKKANDYILIAPDEGLGNFCFFVLDEPTDLENYFAGDVTRCNIGFSLIVWCDLRTISTERGTEGVKEEILNILNGHVHLHSGRMTINKIYERAENVFRGFDYEEIDNQFNMHPFAAFRFEGELLVDTLCMPIVPPTPPVIEPYIAGHIIDGASTFTFKINNQNVTINVGSDGWWKWEVDREITSMASAFENATNLTDLEIYLPSQPTLTSLYRFLRANTVLPFVINIKIRAFDTSKVKNFESAFENVNILDLSFVNQLNTNSATNIYIMLHAQYAQTLDLRNINTANITNWTEYGGINRTIWYNYGLRILHLGKYLTNPASAAQAQGNWAIGGAGYLSLITADKITISTNFKLMNSLIKESVLNIINAAAANVTYTLHATIYPKCASGGEWHTDIQSAIDAKAAQGYVVTLISA